MDFDQGADFVPIDQGPPGHREPRHYDMDNREDGGHSGGAPPPNDGSNMRLYLGNLPKDVTKEQIQNHLGKNGEITEIKLMNGFGFLEFKDPLDAREVVPAFHGTQFMGQRLTVQYARGSRKNDNMSHQERPMPRPRRTVYQVTISDLPQDTSWQDLKDFARNSDLDVVYSDIDRQGRGILEFETANVMSDAVEKLNSSDFKGQPVTVTANQQTERPFNRYGRSRSPGPRRNGGYPPGPPNDYGGYRRPPREYSPRREYRRSPPPQRDWYERDRYDRGPPPRGPPMDEYGPPRGRYDDGGYGPPPARGRFDDYPPPMNGGYGPPRGHNGPPSPRRGDYGPPPMRNAYDQGRGGGGAPGGYDRGPRGW